MLLSDIKKLIGIALLSVFFNGCATPYEMPQDAKLETTPFSTLATIKPEEIKVNKPLPSIDAVQFVLIATDSFNLEAKCDVYWKQVLKQLGFAKTVNSSEYQQMLISTGVLSKEPIGAPLSLIGLNQASKHLPRFLVVSYSDMWLGGAWRRQVMNVIDPVSAATVFQLDRSTMIFLDFDSEYTYPATNEFRTWLLHSREEAKKNPSKPTKVDKSLT